MIIVENVIKYNKSDSFLTSSFIISESGGTTSLKRQNPDIPRLPITSDSESANREYKRFFKEVLDYIIDHAENGNVHKR